MRKLVSMFHTRQPERDEASDAARLKRLVDTLAQIAREVRLEHHGLSARLAEVQDTAAFLNEDGDASNKADRLAALEVELMRAMGRTQQLEAQIRHLAEIETSARRCFCKP